SVKMPRTFSPSITIADPTCLPPMTVAASATVEVGPTEMIPSCMTSRIVAIAWPEPTPGGVGGESRAGVRSRRGREAGPSGVVLAAARRLPVANRPARSLPGPGERGDAPADAGPTGGAGG